MKIKKITDRDIALIVFAICMMFLLCGLAPATAQTPPQSAPEVQDTTPSTPISLDLELVENFLDSLYQVETLPLLEATRIDTVALRASIRQDTCDGYFWARSFMKEDNFFKLKECPVPGEKGECQLSVYLYTDTGHLAINFSSPGGERNFCSPGGERNFCYTVAPDCSVQISAARAKREPQEIGTSGITVNVVRYIAIPVPTMVSEWDPLPAVIQILRQDRD